MNQDYEHVLPEDLEEGEVKLEIEKDAFESIPTCTKCNKGVEKTIVDFDLPGRELTLHLEAYRCKKCHKEFLSGKQAEKFDAMLSLLDAIQHKAKIKFERAANFDGKSWFIRFPSDLTKDWHRKIETDIIPITQSDFFVRIRRDKPK